MTDEPMVERLTVDCPGCSTRFTDERIDALLSQLREQEEVIEAARRFARCVYVESHGAPCNERSGYCTGCRFAQTLAALAPDTPDTTDTCGCGHPESMHAAHDGHCTVRRPQPCHCPDYRKVFVALAPDTDKEN